MSNTYKPKYPALCLECGWEGKRAFNRACPACGHWSPVRRDAVNERRIAAQAVFHLRRLGYEIIDTANGKQAVDSHVAAQIREVVFGKFPSMMMKASAE